MRQGRKIGWTAVVVLLAIMPRAVLAADAPAPNTPAQMLDMADKALAAGGLSSHDTARILVSRGLARETLGQRDDALADFTTAISSNALERGELARALYDRGVTLDELNRTEDAIGDYTGALRLDPTLAAALNNRGNAYRRLGRLAEARRDYEASIAAGNPHPEYSDYGMGQIAETLAQPSAARAYYRAALAANPQFALAADRLTALGVGTVADPANAPVVLRPPGGAEAPAAIHLTPPGGAEAPAAIHLTPPHRAKPDLVLKPAINDAGAEQGHAVQLGAWRSEAEANAAWAGLQARAGEILAGMAPVIVPADVPHKGLYYRLRVGPLEPGAAPRLCQALKAKGLACLVALD
jgi:tetratricopeptide (TPR) repeat protein